MRLGEFAQLLNERFSLERFAEPDGWEFAISENEKAELLKRASAIFKRTFNGLMLGEDHAGSVLTRVHLLVFPESSLLEQVIEAEREAGGGSAIVTHHPVDMETSGREFVAIPAEQLDALDRAGVGFYVLHAPLDCDLEISTSRALAEGLGLEVTDAFAPYAGGLCGVIGNQAPEPFARFAERVRELCELPFFLADQVRFAGRDVSRVAIVAGGGDDPSYLEEAARRGLLSRRTLVDAPSGGVVRSKPGRASRRDRAEPDELAQRVARRVGAGGASRPSCAAVRILGA